jgi:hypothetical protein
MIGACVGKRIVGITEGRGTCRLLLENGETIRLWVEARTSSDHCLDAWLGYAVERREAEPRPFEAVP